MDESETNPQTHRIVLGVRYDGHGFEGWQTQTHGNTVQDALSRAIGKIAGAAPCLHCAGRTDAGVHARQQLAHFDTCAKRPVSAWVHGVNRFLPDTICVTGAKEVPNEFHARFLAVCRTYRYYFYSAKGRDPFKRFMTWIHYPLDLDNMQRAASFFVGTHDFSAFRAAQCQAQTPIRHIYKFDLIQEQDFFYFEISGNAFLHHMVRNLIGTLMEVGLKRQPCEWVAQVLNSKDRSQAAKTYPAKGLTLWKVDYPAQYDIDALFEDQMSSLSLKDFC